MQALFSSRSFLLTRQTQYDFFYKSLGATLKDLI